MLGILVTLCLAGCAEEKIPVGVQQPTWVDISQTLEVYAKLAGKKVLVSPQILKDDKVISVRQTKPMTRTEACKLLEQDLREQAGIVILHQDRKTVIFGFPATEKFEPEP